MERVVNMAVLSQVYQEQTGVGHTTQELVGARECASAVATDHVGSVGVSSKKKKVRWELDPPDDRRGFEMSG